MSPLKNRSVWSNWTSFDKLKVFLKVRKLAIWPGPIGTIRTLKSNDLRLLSNVCAWGSETGPHALKTKEASWEDSRMDGESSTLNFAIGDRYILIDTIFVPTVTDRHQCTTKKLPVSEFKYIYFQEFTFLSRIFRMKTVYYPRHDTFLWY